ncbi:hypothetical protein [Helicobacter rodentium]|uniref:hypothetical protein n=1 Tax=Helicobacter rodentium TaxID=59617 RepID=UPI0023F15FE2|nr:hypothetical protein [Helicobacter rodentium]
MDCNDSTNAESYNDKVGRNMESLKYARLWIASLAFAMTQWNPSSAQYYRLLCLFIPRNNRI